MAKTLSTMTKLGSKAIDFTLPDTVSGNNINLYKEKSNIACKNKHRVY